MNVGAGHGALATIGKGELTAIWQFFGVYLYVRPKFNI
jgi:hypothetical protein